MLKSNLNPFLKKCDISLKEVRHPSFSAKQYNPGVVRDAIIRGSAMAVNQTPALKWICFFDQFPLLEMSIFAR